MGSWGNGLYDNDTALDIKDGFEGLLADGCAPDEITGKIKNLNEALLRDDEDSVIFWLVLADLEWNNGYLDEQVLQNALEYIDDGTSEAPEKPHIYSKRVLLSLKKKLLKEPKKTRVSKASKKTPHQRRWSIGDVFAYPIKSDDAVNIGLGGEYFVIHVVGEYEDDRKKIIPIARVKVTKGGKIPVNSADINSLEYVLISHFSYNYNYLMFRDEAATAIRDDGTIELEHHRDELGLFPVFIMRLDIPAKKHLDGLIYIGNHDNIDPPKIEFTPSGVSIQLVLWKYFENSLVYDYKLYNLRQASFYNNLPDKPERILTRLEALQRMAEDLRAAYDRMVSRYNK